MGLSFTLLKLKLAVIAIFAATISFGQNNAVAFNLPLESEQFHEFEEKRQLFELDLEIDADVDSLDLRDFSSLRKLNFRVSIGCQIGAVIFPASIKDIGVEGINIDQLMDFLRQLRQLDKLRVKTLLKLEDEGLFLELNRLNTRYLELSSFKVSTDLQIEEQLPRIQTLRLGIGKRNAHSSQTIFNACPNLLECCISFYGLSNKKRKLLVTSIPTRIESIALVNVGSTFMDVNLSRFGNAKRVVLKGNFELDLNEILISPSVLDLCLIDCDYHGIGMLINSRPDIEVTVHRSSGAVLCDSPLVESVNYSFGHMQDHIFTSRLDELWTEE